MIAEIISPATLGFILVAVMLFAIFIGFPISFTLIFLGFVFGYLGFGPLVLFLKNIDVKKHQGRLNLLKGFLIGRDIPFKDGLWDWQTRNLN